MSHVEDTLGRVLSLAKTLAKGADVVVTADARREANTRFARNEITSNGDVEETRLGVTIAYGKRHATATTNQVDERSIRAAIARASEMARLVPEDPEWMPPLPQQAYREVPSSHDPATAALGAEGRAAAIAQAVGAGEAQKLDVAGFLNHDAGSRAVATSAGLVARHDGSRVTMTVTARTQDGTGSGWGSGTSYRFADVDVPTLSRTAADKAVRSARPASLDPGRYTVILEPAAVADLMNFFVSALDARKTDEGRSFFSKAGGGNRLGETIASPLVTLRADPADPELPSRPFDDEGVPLDAFVPIDRGVATALTYSRYWAAKQGKTPTGRRETWHLLGGAASDAADLLAGVARGLVITRFFYTRWVDPQSVLITGLTRDGVFLVENGKITRPVNNFRFNESPVTMLKNCDALTKRTWRVGSWRAPALRTHEFNLASRSDAV